MLAEALVRRAVARAVNAAHLVVLVCAGATFINGKLAERSDDQSQPDAA
jgi:hypothetical protein